MRIGELASRAGVTQKAVRYYERCGLLKPRRMPSGYRDFDERALTIVQTIRRSQNLGMHVQDVRDVIALIEQGSVPCATVRALLAEKRSEIAQRIKELRAFDALLASLEAADAPAGEGCAILTRAPNRPVLEESKERLRTSRAAKGRH